MSEEMVPVRVERTVTLRLEVMVPKRLADDMPDELRDELINEVMSDNCEFDADTEFFTADELDERDTISPEYTAVELGNGDFEVRG